MLALWPPDGYWYSAQTIETTATGNVYSQEKKTSKSIVLGLQYSAIIAVFFISGKILVQYDDGIRRALYAHQVGVPHSSSASGNNIRLTPLFYLVCYTMKCEYFSSSYVLVVSA